MASLATLGGRSGPPYWAASIKIEVIVLAGISILFGVLMLFISQSPRLGGAALT